MCSASYGISSPRVSAIRSRSASGSCSDSTSWKTSARRRYDSTSASGRPAAGAAGTPAAPCRGAVGLRAIRGPIGAVRPKLEWRILARHPTSRPDYPGAGAASHAGTVALLHSFRMRDFAVGTVYSKTEVIQVALLSAVLLGEPLEPL